MFHYVICKSMERNSTMLIQENCICDEKSTLNIETESMYNKCDFCQKEIDNIFIHQNIIIDYFD